MRIKTYLVGMIAVVLLPLGIAALLAIDKVREGERRAAIEALHVTVRATALVIDREVQKSWGALSVLGRSEHFQTGNFAALYKQAEAMNSAPDVWTLALDETGTQVFNTAVPFGTPPPASVAKEKVARVLATGRPYISDLIVGSVSGKLGTTLYVPAVAVNGKRYVVAQVFSINHWKNAALLPQGRPEWLVGVLDQAGHFIFRSQRTDELLGKSARPELIQAMSSEDSGLLMHSTLEGVDVFDAFAHSKSTGWGVAVAAPVASIESSGTAAGKRLLAGTLLAMLVAAVLATFLARKVIAGVQQAAKAAEDLGSGKQIHAEVGGLNEFNDLSSAMANASRVLENAKDLRDVSEKERQRLLESERVAKKLAEDQNRKKDEFLAMLGHELRNPLAAISTATYLLEMRGEDSSVRERSTTIIVRQNKHLQHIVDDLLDVSRLLAGKIELNLDYVDLAVCAEACVDAIRDTPSASDRNLVLKVETAWVRGDLSRLEQIVNNLLSNALKYSPRGSDIIVTVRTSENSAHLSVADNGMGMAKSLIPNVFEPFTQGPALGHRTSSGLGVGLALVKQLVELHGGTITAKSAGVGQGSESSMVLPSVEPMTNTEKLSQSIPDALTDTLQLLLVEDNEDARLAITEVLEAMGISVTAASSGQQGIQYVEHEKFDVGVLDIGLPDISGYALAQKIHELRPNLPLIALTGYGQNEDKEKARIAGFATHLTKPAAINELMAALKALVEVNG